MVILKLLTAASGSKLSRKLYVVDSKHSLYFQKKTKLNIYLLSKYVLGKNKEFKAKVLKANTLI